MEQKEVDLTMYDRDASIVQHTADVLKENQIRRIEARGLPVTVESGLAYISLQDADDYTEVQERLTTPSKAPDLPIDPLGDHQ